MVAWRRCCVRWATEKRAHNTPVVLSTYAVTVLTLAMSIETFR